MGSRFLNQRFVAFLKSLVPPLLPLVLIVAFLEVAIRHGLISSFILPKPTDVVSVLFVDRDELIAALLQTSEAAFAGLAASLLLGTSLAITFSFSSFLRRAIYPYAVFFQTVPIIAIAPLLVIWFGFGRPTVVASAFIVSIFPIIANTLLGLESTDPMLLDLFRLYRASTLRTMVSLRLPSALPYIFSGLRIASGLAVIGAIVGEFVAGGGLGAVVDVARTQQRIDKVFAAVIISAGIGLLMVATINLISWSSLRHWHASAKQS
jgi:NitT/TauT family transport system permease protein